MYRRRCYEIKDVEAGSNTYGNQVSETGGLTKADFAESKGETERSTAELRQSVRRRTAVELCNKTAAKRKLRLLAD